MNHLMIGTCPECWAGIPSVPKIDTCETCQGRGLVEWLCECGNNTECDNCAAHYVPGGFKEVLDHVK